MTQVQSKQFFGKKVINTNIVTHVGEYLHIVLLPFAYKRLLPCILHCRRCMRHSEQAFNGSTVILWSSLFGTYCLYMFNRCVLQLLLTVYSIQYQSITLSKLNHLHLFLVRVRLRTEVLCTFSLIRLGFKLMTSRSSQFMSLRWLL